MFEKLKKKIADKVIESVQDQIDVKKLEMLSRDIASIITTISMRRNKNTITLHDGDFFIF